MRKWEYKKVALNEAPRRGDEIDLLHGHAEPRADLAAEPRHLGRVHVQIGALLLDDGEQ